MNRKTINDVIKTYLKEVGFEGQEATSLIRKFHKNVKDANDGETEVRHGTTCFGIINKKREETVFEM